MNFKKGMKLLNQIAVAELDKSNAKYICSCSEHYSNLPGTKIGGKVICGGTWKLNNNKKQT